MSQKFRYKVKNERTIKMLEEQLESSKSKVREFYNVEMTNEVGAILDKLFMEQYELYRLIDICNMSGDAKNKADFRRYVSINRKHIVKAKGDACECCGFNFVDILNIHHIVAIRDGGDNGIDNLAVLCPNCHSLIHKLQNKKFDIALFDKWANENVTVKTKNKLIFFIQQSQKY